MKQRSSRVESSVAAPSYAGAFAPLAGSLPPANETALAEALSRPNDNVMQAMALMDSDLIVLGAGGKMGLSLATMASRALRVMGSSRRVIAVSRFSDGVDRFLAAEIETIRRDLLDEDELKELPDARNVVFMAGTKFGSSDAPSATWAINTLLPAQVARRYRDARIVALSTGNVYPFSAVTSGGSIETDEPKPVGEYALTCLGRERMFEWVSHRYGTPTTLIRLNYANALRYGVLVDIAVKVLAGQAIDVTMGSVNVIWQGDANAAILRAFGITASPPTILNVAGPEIVSVRWAAYRFADLLGVPAPEIVGDEAETALLSNSSRMHQLFGPPSISLDQLVSWTATWVQRGGSLLGKPTGFTVRDGRF